MLGILLADDHALIRSGLRLEIVKHFECSIHEAGDGVEALKMIRERRPDIAILDIEMPGLTGLEVAERLKESDSQTSLVFLTMYEDKVLLDKSLELGGRGFLLKGSALTEIRDSLHYVLKGKHYLSPAVSDYLVRRVKSREADIPESNLLNRLTKTERTILRSLSKLMTNREIAKKLSIRIKTVKNHRTNMCNKLELTGPHALLKFAVDHADHLES